MSFLFRLLLFLLLFYFLRQVLQVLIPGLFPRGENKASRQVGAERNLRVKHGTMEKDPVCGTYVDVATSLQLTADGETLYFCSSGCMDKFKRGSKG